MDAQESAGSLLEGWTLVNPKLRQGSTFLRALKGEGNSAQDDLNNSTWKFTGDVHLEFDGAVLDAQSATAVFVNGLLSSVVVQAAASPQPRKQVHVEFKDAVLDVDQAAVAFSGGRIQTIQATGAPTQFSYPRKKLGRRVNGRAGKIDYDAVRNEISFRVDTSYTDGPTVAKTPELTYNFSTDRMTTKELQSTYSADDRVPAPRPPDRATAK